MPMKKGDTDMKVPLCSVADIPDEGAKAVDFFGRPVLVYRVNGRPRAIANVCLHLGGPLGCDGDKFVCPWHGAEYARVDGRRIAGPVRQDARLMVIPTRVEDGVLNYVYGE
jgi:nitrite reductase/ring-hydroxylating ferredoxin subunit